MKHFAASEFWDHYRQLPPEVRALADKNFVLLKADPRHSSVRLKKVGAFCKEQPDGLAWFWIGPHSTYDHYT